MSPAHPLRLRTKRLELVAADAALARIEADGNFVRLGALLRARVPAEWPPAETRDVLALFAERLATCPEQAGWWGWYFIRAESKAQRVLIGGGGFKSPADGRIVETGYSLLPEFRRQGYASEAVAALVNWAFAHPAVLAVGAETSPDNAGSLGVLRSVGMQPVGAGAEPGTVRYEIARPPGGA